MPAKVEQKDEEQPQHLVVASHHHGSDFGSKVIVGAAVIEAALLAVYGAVEPSFLPLGGGHFEQGGVIFCSVVAVEGFHHLYRQGAFTPVINAVAGLGDFTIRKSKEVVELTKVGGKLLRRLGVKAGKAVIEFVKSMVEKPAAPMGPPKPVQKRSVERREVRAPRQHRRIVVIIVVPVLRGLNRVLDLATIGKVKVRRLLRELELSAALLAHQPQRQRYD